MEMEKVLTEQLPSMNVENQQKPKRDNSCVMTLYGKFIPYVILEPMGQLNQYTTQRNSQPL